jgi:hypothetical protein
MMTVHNQDDYDRVLYDLTGMSEGI